MRFCAKAVDEFLKKQNWSTSDARNWNLAVKFLMARKFDVNRAIKLYEDHETLRKKEDLYNINLSDELFIKDLETGKFTILVKFIIITINNNNNNKKSSS